MRWQLFHLTAMGGAHRQRQLPCQDCALSAQERGARIVMVADGTIYEQSAETASGTPIE